MEVTQSARRVLLGLVLAALPVVAHADDAPKPPPRDDEVKVENGAFVIKGQVQKPQIVVAVRRQPLAAQIDLELKESFLHKILDATEEPPF